VHGSLGRHCLWPYFSRLAGIAAWNFFVTGAYVKLRQDAALTRMYLRNVAIFAAAMLCVRAFAELPNSEALLAAVLGDAASDMSRTATLVGCALQAATLVAAFTGHTGVL
jgi:hypothetical protein